MRAEATSVAHRFAQAQAWWIAAQLVARNSRLRLYQQVDIFDGEALVLELQDSTPNHGEAQPPVRVVLGEDGLKLVAQVAFQTMFWDEVFSFADPLEVVERIEASIELTPCVFALPELRPRALTYLVIALTLAARVNAPHTFHVRSIAPTVCGVDGWALTDLSTFPSLEEYLMARFELDVARGFEPRVTPAWILYEGIEPIAAFDEAGGVHSQGTRSSVSRIHKNLAGHIQATVITDATIIPG